MGVIGAKIMAVMAQPTAVPSRSRICFFLVDLWWSEFFFFLVVYRYSTDTACMERRYVAEP